MTDVGEPKISPAEQQSFRDLLTEQRQQADEQIEALSKSFDDIVEAVELTNNDDEHDPEGTTIAFERAQVLALLEQAKADRDAVDSALERLAGGAYGTCADCGGAIGLERLRAIPSASKCVNSA